MMAIAFMALAFVISIGVLQPVNDKTESARTKQVIDTNKSCDNPIVAPATSCEVTLSEQSQYAVISTNGGGVQETSPTSTDRTSSTTVSTDRTKITVTGLTAGTSYLFTITYYGLNTGVDQFTSNVMQYIPIMLILGSLFIALLWLLTSLNAIKT
tara:strand:+ start:7600 stop:8064 length:465 start_codon:yes stop_codon:yes gene_type:complete